MSKSIEKTMKNVIKNYVRISECLIQGIGRIDLYYAIEQSKTTTGE